MNTLRIMSLYSVRDMECATKIQAVWKGRRTRIKLKNLFVNLPQELRRKVLYYVKYDHIYRTKILPLYRRIYEDKLVKLKHEIYEIRNSMNSLLLRNPDALKIYWTYTSSIIKSHNTADYYKWVLSEIKFYSSVKIHFTTFYIP